MTTPSLRVYPLLYLPRCPTWTCAISNPYMDHIWVTPVPKIGLWTLSPRFSAVFLPLEPTIEFSTWSAVSPSKSHDFRLYEPAIPFFHLVSGFPHHVTCLSPRSFFPTGQRFLLPKHVTSGCMSPRSPFSTWSAVS